MKKILALIALLLALHGTALAQSAIARFKFEDAEAAFANKEYQKALAALEEAETALGKVNPPIAYLRIQARNELLAKDSPSFDQVEKLRADCMAYLKNYGELEVVRDQAREIYRIHESLDRYPQNRLAYAQDLVDHARFDDAWAQVELLPRNAGKPTRDERRDQIVLMDRIVSFEYYVNAAHARALNKTVQAYLAQPGQSSAADLQPVQRIARNLRGLEDYLTAKQFHNIEKDYAQAMTYHTRAAEQGSPMGMAALGVLHAHGFGVDRNDDVARQWFEKSVAAGDARIAMYWLGAFANAGRAMPKDQEAARKWFEKGAALGDADSMVYLARLAGAGKDEPTNLQWARKAADLGSAVGAFDLGALYWNGKGVEQSGANAEKWLTRSAELGYEKAYYWVGSLYWQGKLVTRDFAKSYTSYMKGAEREDKDSMHMVGVQLQLGQGVPQNYSQAIGWYEKAAAKGDASSMKQLALMAKAGMGTKSDWAAAAEWFTNAVDAGDTDSLAELATLYETGGPGLKRDKSIAAEWRNKAQAAKDATAAR